MIKPNNRTLGAKGKTSKPGFARWKCTPIPACGGTSPKGKHVTGFSVVYDSLRIQFLCHPGGGSLLSASLPASTCHPERQRRISVLDDYETNAIKYRSAGRSRLRWLSPFGALRHHLPTRCAVGQQPEGNHLPPISISRHSAAKTSPSGGGAVGRRGAFPRAPTRLACFPRPSGRFACFPSGDSPVVKVLFILAAQPPTTTLSGEAAVKL